MTPDLGRGPCLLIYDIEWDTDGEGQKGHPRDIVVYDWEQIQDYMVDGDFGGVAGLCSDIRGWCVLSCNYEIVTRSNRSFGRTWDESGISCPVWHSHGPDRNELCY